MVKSFIMGIYIYICAMVEKLKYVTITWGMVNLPLRGIYIYRCIYLYIYTQEIYIIYIYIWIYIYMAPFFQLPYSQHPHHGTRTRPPCCRVYLRYLRTEGSDEFVLHLHCEMEKIPEWWKKTGGFVETSWNFRPSVTRSDTSSRCLKHPMGASVQLAGLESFTLDERSQRWEPFLQPSQCQ